MSNPYTSTIRTQEDRSLPNLSHLPSALTDDDVIGFGQFAEMKLSEVPIWFFTWMVKQQTEYPRVDRSARWCLVIEWIKSKK
ncbi:MAG TPA: hypothetical protein PKD51_11430 [Saprospiraceae bacterium]|mgnify:CR=1 FL=1|nr:hypothetical protein [Saprospiraceae bacterium]